MPHFTDYDQLITSDEIGTTKEWSLVHQEAAFVVDGDCATTRLWITGLQR